MRLRIAIQSRHAGIARRAPGQLVGMQPHQARFPARMLVGSEGDGCPAAPDRAVAASRLCALRRAPAAAVPPPRHARPGPRACASIAAVGPSRRRPSRRQFLHRDPAGEIVDRQAAVGARIAIGRQHVVGARTVIAHRLRATNHRGTPSRRCARARAGAWLAHLRGSDARARTLADLDALRRSGMTRMRELAQRLTQNALPRQRRASAVRPARPRSARAAAGGEQHAPARRGSCSACASRSAATNSGRALSSAITSTSDGPAGRSSAAPSGSAATSCLAAVTQALPGPKILSTLGTLAVP